MMKAYKYIASLCCALVLTACMGDEEITPTAGTSAAGTAVVASDGTIDFTGSGDLDGVAVSATVAGLAGSTMTITRTSSVAVVDNRSVLSDMYTVSFTPVPAGTSTVNVTIPYIEEAFTAAGVAHGDVTVYRYAGGTATALSTSHPADFSVSASGSAPGTFFAGVPAVTSAATSGKGIVMDADGYDAAETNGDTVTLPDGGSTVVAQPVRGISHVQPGETVKLDVSSATLGAGVSSVTWTLTSQPGGSTATLTTAGTTATFVPDAFGEYVIDADITTTGGAVVTETITIRALGYSYNDATGDNKCADCHAGQYTGGSSLLGGNVLRDIATPWAASAHGTAFANVDNDANSPECFVCHTTGFFFADAAPTDGTDDFPATYGYDDLINDWANPASSPTFTHMENVTCEACHGTSTTYTGAVDGSQTFTHPPKPSYDSGACLSCHDTGTTVSGHYGRFGSAHDGSHEVLNGIVARNESCFTCHTGLGALSEMLDLGVDPAEVEQPFGVSCIVCHDPHGESGNAYNLRDTGDAVVLDTTVTAGNAKLCYQCHTADTALPTVGTQLHNTQAEMYAGVGGYEYDNASVSDVSSHAASFDMTCLSCHMTNDLGTTHDLGMGSDLASRTAYCQATCHSAATGLWFNYYDRISTLSTMLGNLKTEINTVAGVDASTAITADYSGYGLPAATVTALNRAAYNYNFIVADRSGGAHNYKYARNLINASISDLQGL